MDLGFVRPYRRGDRGHFRHRPRHRQPVAAGRRPRRHLRPRRRPPRRRAGGPGDRRRAAAAPTQTPSSPTTATLLDRTLESQLSPTPSPPGPTQRIDLLVNNAGQGRVSTFARHHRRRLAAELNLKFFSQILPIRAFTPFLERSTAPAIVAVNSLLAYQPEPHMVCTSAARAGVQSLLKSLAAEFAPAIRVNAILLGLIDSGQWQRRFEARADHTSPAKPGSPNSPTPRASRSAASATPRNPPGRSFSSARPRRATSPAPVSKSLAASPGTSERWNPWTLHPPLRPKSSPKNPSVT